MKVYHTISQSKVEMTTEKLKKKTTSYLRKWSQVQYLLPIQTNLPEGCVTPC